MAAPTPADFTAIADRIESYLTRSLLPFWIENTADPQHGGVLTYFDRHGRKTGETTKPFLMQVRMLYTLSSAHRAGYGGGRCAEAAAPLARFILERYWDDKEDGWFWIADREGRPTVVDKVGYGHCFGIYAFSEYFLATGDKLGRQAAEATYSAVCRHMAETQHGGFLELMERDWRPKPAGRLGGDRKSLDVHMHMMEAMTTFTEMTRHPSHARRLREVIQLILTRMLHPQSLLGYMQFTYDWTPLAPIIFGTDWGRDAQTDGSRGPLDTTSPGHNVEFIWLLLHALETLGDSHEPVIEVIRRNCDHCVRYGMDHEFGGVYADVPMDRPTAQLEKQFWQQAEVMIGMLDAYRVLGDTKYWDAFRNVHDFVFTKMIAHDSGGEWYERLDREGRVIDSALGHAWKSSYHTVRAPIQAVRRLRRLAASAR